MNEAFKRRLVGLLTLAAIALLLSWLLPRPGLRKLEGTEERVAAMDLTKPGSPAQEILPETMDTAPADGAKAKGAEGSTLFPLPADPNAPDLDAAAEEESAPDAQASPDQPAALPPDKAVAESLAAEKASAAKVAADKAAADKVAAERIAAQKAAADKASADKVAADKLAADKAAAAKLAEKPVAPPANPTAAAPTTTAAAAPPKPTAGGTWYAQCGVYSLLSNAQSLRDDLAKRGMKCDMTPLENAKGTAYRVRCGPFKTRGEAEIIVSRISDRVKAIVVDGAR